MLNEFTDIKGKTNAQGEIEAVLSTAVGSNNSGHTLRELREKFLGHLWYVRSDRDVPSP